MKLRIETDGSIKMIYSDELTNAFDGLGTVTTTRASNVEPTEGGWSADLAPVGGPILGPFPLRKDALTAEVKWLEDHIIGAQSFAEPGGCPFHTTNL